LLIHSPPDAAPEINLVAEIQNRSEARVGIGWDGKDIAGGVLLPRHEDFSGERREKVTAAQTEDGTGLVDPSEGGASLGVGFPGLLEERGEFGIREG
jgi:hypothetical protein